VHRFTLTRDTADKDYIIFRTTQPRREHHLAGEDDHYKHRPVRSGIGSTTKAVVGAYVEAVFGTYIERVLCRDCGAGRLGC
jgi:hypothetical protein